MECIIRNERMYKRGRIIMGKNKNLEKAEKEFEEKENNINTKKNSLNYVASIFSIIVGIITVGGVIKGAFTYIINLNNNITYLVEESKKVNDYLFENKNSVEKQLEEINRNLNIPVKISASDEFASITIEHNNNFKSSDNIKSVFNSKTLLGKDSNGNTYIAEKLIGKTILVSYNDKSSDGDDVEVYFLGQYNEDYKWDGFCTTNAYYLDGTLYSICESNFRNGKRLDFKSIVYQPSNSDWLYSDRIIHETENLGINIHYVINDSVKKQFENLDVKESDILYVDNFLKSVNPIMTKYYSGNTSDGYFNDDTGNAYRVTYYEDGTVESIYVGKFVDGYPNDDTGNAWKISYSENTKGYEYYKGKFDDDNDEYKSNDTPTPISIDEINKIVSEYNFACELKWK